VKRFAAAGRPGAYLRVLEEGVAGAGDPIEVLSRPEDGVTVAGALRAYYGDADLMRRLLDAPGLDPGWHDAAVSVLARSVPPEPAGLIVPGALPPGAPVPADGALPAAAAAVTGPPAVRVLRARAVLPAPLRLLATSTPTPPPSSGPGSPGTPTPRWPPRRSGVARRVLGPAAGPVATVFFGGGTPTLLPAGQLGEILAGHRG